MTRLSDEQLARIQSFLSRLEAELRAEVQALKDAKILSPGTRCRVIQGEVDHAEMCFSLGPRSASPARELSRDGRWPS